MHSSSHYYLPCRNNPIIYVIHTIEIHETECYVFLIVVISFHVTLPGSSYFMPTILKYASKAINTWLLLGVDKVSQRFVRLAVKKNRVSMVPEYFE